MDVDLDIILLIRGKKKLEKYICQGTCTRVQKENIMLVVNPKHTARINCIQVVVLISSLVDRICIIVVTCHYQYMARQT